MKAITKGQKTVIWTIVRKNGLDEEEFREWLGREFGTRSTRALSSSDAESVIRSLKRYTGETYEERVRTWGITGKQMRMARGVAHDIGWDDPKRLDGLVAKMFDPKNRLELLNKKEGSKLIVALERMRDEVRDGIREFA